MIWLIVAPCVGVPLFLLAACRVGSTADYDGAIIGATDHIPDDWGHEDPYPASRLRLVVKAAEKTIPIHNVEVQ